jgi:hypothetical protein
MQIRFHYPLPKRKYFPSVENQSEEIQSEPAPMQRMATTKNPLKQTGELFGGSAPDYPKRE